MAFTVRTNCPRDCYDGCGIVASVDSAGRAQVKGDPEHPVARGALCSKCSVAYNGVFQDAAQRLSTPLKRVGAKGAGQFEPVSWDSALADIAAQLKNILAEQGPDAILCMNYSGTLSLLAHFFPYRWMNYLGVAQVEYDSICNAAGYVAWDLLFGGADQGFDPRTAKDASCILVWGANPSHSAPHAHKHWLAESPAKVITVDPIRTQTASQSDLHLQPRPGTDAALAFGIAHALLEMDKFDDEFLRNHVIGLDDVRPFNFRQRQAMSIYAVPRVQEEVKSRFSYVFEPSPYPGAPNLELRDLDKSQPFSIAGMHFQPIEVMHGRMPVLGFRVGDFTYITDAKTISPEELDKVRGTRLLVLNALHHKEHHSHLNLEQALAIINEVRPEQAYLTHISHQMGKYEDIQPRLPDGVFLATDKITICP